jgi:DNA-binding transcriptional ArsR family regulator
MVDPAELFEAISHPERIKILKILSKKPSSFAALKRQLSIQSSGNLDYHLKKLSPLVTVREDGLYGLTDAGKEALLSVEAIEMWTEMERHKLKMPSKIPKAAFLLGLLELCMTAVLLWYFSAIMQVPFSLDNTWGYLFFATLLLAGFSSGIGIFVRWEWSLTVMLSKSAVIMLMSLFLLDYRWWTPTQPCSVAMSYLLFVVAEAVIVLMSLVHPLKDFLMLRSDAKPSLSAIVGSLLCVFSGVLLILLESAKSILLAKTPQPNFNTVFGSITDISILCGLAIAIGGILILMRSYTLGALMSIIFGLFPPRQIQIPGYPAYHADHIFDIFYAMNIPAALLIAVIAGSLPIIGAALPLVSIQKTRR